MSDQQKKDLPEELQRLNQMETSDVERHYVEKALGKGAIKFKLDRAGMHKLFQAHNKEDNA